MAAEPSCYLLEHSTKPGGARMGDIHAYSDVGELWASFERRGGVDPYLVTWYGCLLHLWVVRHGVVVDGIDLHPYLRTGDPRGDALLTRFLYDPDDSLNDAYESIREFYDDGIAALPMLARLYELRDRELAGDEDAAEAVEDLICADAPPDDLPALDVGDLTVDWDALLDRIPPLEPPLLGHGTVTVHWPDGRPTEPDSHVTHGRHLHAGINDTETGRDEYP